MFRLCAHGVGRYSKFNNQRVGLPHSRREGVGKTVIVPQCPFSITVEPLEHVLAGAKIGEDGPGVVQFVGGRDQECIGACGPQMTEVARLAFKPGGFLAGTVWRTIGTGENDVGDAMPEPLPNDRFVVLATILENVVKEGSNGLIFVASVLHHQRRHRHKVREVRNRRALPPLRAMRYSRVFHCRGDAVGWLFGFHGDRAFAARYRYKCANVKWRAWAPCLAASWQGN